jgi:hypothetical protein
MTGSVATFHARDKRIIHLTATLVNYTVWQWKLKKIIPSIATVTNEVDYLFEGICDTSSKIENIAMLSGTPI